MFVGATCMSDCLFKTGRCIVNILYFFFHDLDVIFSMVQN